MFCIWFVALVWFILSYYCDMFYMPLLCSLFYASTYLLLTCLLLSNTFSLYVEFDSSTLERGSCQRRLTHSHTVPCFCCLSAFCIDPCVIMESCIWFLAYFHLKCSCTENNAAVWFIFEVCHKHHVCKLIKLVNELCEQTNEILRM